MGGKLIVLMHDFRQILPVVQGGNKAAIISTTVMNSDIWRHFKPLHLTKNMQVERLLQQGNHTQERIYDLRIYSD